LPFRWDAYSEHLLLYLLAIGSPRTPIPAESWYAWKRDETTFYGHTYIQSLGSLFVHQYSHAWIDFRGYRDEFGKGTDWFQNSVQATLAHRTFCAGLSQEFKSFADGVWGVTASDSESGYLDWGGPPRHPNLDGTLVPSALTGSMMFTPTLAKESLETMFKHYGSYAFGRYGFNNAFNPITKWKSPDVIGIDVGISLLSIENFRKNLVWKWFMHNKEIATAFKRIGLTRPPENTALKSRVQKVEEQL
jgi:hypothetical protein